MAYVREICETCGAAKKPSITHKLCNGPGCNGKLLPVSEFHKNRSTVTGYMGWCKKCHIAAASLSRSKRRGTKIAA